MFADGGLMSLGANVFNMGIVSVCGGYAVFRSVKRLIWMEETRSTVFAAAFAAWFGTVLASIFCAGELALSRTAPWSFAFPAMANVHMIIGLGEGLVTGLIVLTVLRNRPQLPPPSGNGFVTYGLLICLGLAVFVAPFACPWPDGLASVGKALGFDAKEAPAALSAPFADYRLPFIGSVTVATAVAGAIGTVLAFMAAYGLARALVPALSVPKKDASPGN
jgi:cobalt/nickel transport system permease protein